MAEETQGDEKKPNMVPLIIGVVIVIVIIGFFMSRGRQPKETAKLPPRPKADPCEGLPDWACGTLQILDPLAKTSVDVYKAQAQSDIELARIKARRA